MIFVHLLACSLTNDQSTVNVLNGNWEILHSDTPMELVQLEGFGFHFEMEDQIWLWCLFDCVGAFKYHHEDITVVSQNASTTIDGFRHLYSRSSGSTVRVLNTTVVDVQAVQGDVWIDAPRDGRISSFSYGATVQISVSEELLHDWKVEAISPNIRYPLMMNLDEADNVMRLFSNNGHTEVVPIRNISAL